MNKNYHFTTDYFSENIPRLCNIHLSHLKNKENVSILEIGSWEGRSCCWFLDNILTGKNSTITCIDTWQGSMEHQLIDSKNFIWQTFNNNIKNFPSEKVIIKKGFSKDVLKDPTLGKYDFIYIDGSHTTVDVLTDAVLSFPLLKVGGVMIFDDFLWTVYEDPLLCPRIGIEAFLNCFQRKYVVLEIGYQVAIKKVAD